MKTKIGAVLIAALLFSCKASQPDEINIGCKSACFIKATLNGKPAIFLLDTGAGVTIIDYGIANDYGVGIGEEAALLTGVNGNGGYIYRTSNARLTVGGIGVGEEIFTANLTDLRERIKADGIDIAGILGNNFLMKRGAVIDYNTKKLKL